MNRPKLRDIAIEAFYDNFMLAALFGKLRIPGAPREIIDPRTLDEFKRDEFLLSVEDFKKEIDRIEALVQGGDRLRSVTESEDSLFSNETLQELLGGWTESSLKPLENSHQSR